MKIDQLTTNSANEVSELFLRVFSASEGADEGQAVAALAGDLVANIDNSRILGFSAAIEQQLVAAIVFSRLSYPERDSVMMLSPVAVATEHHGQGIGQQLIKHAIEELKQQQVTVVVTYGDPAFYGKVGFEPVSESLVKSPMPLSMPQGWLAQSLTRQSLIDEVGTSLSDKPNCVQQFMNPDLW